MQQQKQQGGSSRSSSAIWLLVAAYEMMAFSVDVGSKPQQCKGCCDLLMLPSDTMPQSTAACTAQANQTVVRHTQGCTQLEPTVYAEHKAEHHSSANPKHRQFRLKRQKAAMRPGVHSS
jgi:hypothetical protein